MKQSNLRFPAVHFIAVLVFLALAAFALYGSFLSSPLVFDDFTYFGPNLADDLNSMSGFGLRWLPGASFGWIRAFAGDDMVWQRLANLLLHIANCALLFLFLRRLFDATLAPATPSPIADSARPALALPWLAFFGALWFALNPVAVYGVAYLAQRTILLSTLFALLTWILFLEGLLRQQSRWLLASCASYLLAVLSKEHAIMAPAVALALLLLVRKPSRPLLIQVAPTFFLYTLIAAFTFFQVKSGGVVGRAYEPYGLNMLTELGISAQQAYALSVLSQSYLFFKYLLLWLVPNPGWMSVDMMEPFARSLWSWPQTPALLAFLLYPAVAFWLLLQRGRRGLLGFALLAPWLLFATELSTVRIQENFVLYRSYLWMPCLLVALPFLLHRVSAAYSFLLLLALSLALLAASWNRLDTFSDTFRLWDDALQLAQNKEQSPRMIRLYYNRGNAYSKRGLHQPAIDDYSRAIAIHPGVSQLYNNRGFSYFELGRYAQAMRDFDQTILINPNHAKAYVGRAMIFEIAKNYQASMENFKRSCEIGLPLTCPKWKALYRDMHGKTP